MPAGDAEIEGTGSVDWKGRLARQCIPHQAAMCITTDDAEFLTEAFDLALSELLSRHGKHDCSSIISSITGIPTDPEENCTYLKANVTMSTCW